MGIIMLSSIKLILFLKKKSFIKTKVINKISIKISKTEELRIISNESSVLIQKDNKMLSIKENTILGLKSNHVQKKAIKIVLSIVFVFIIQWLPLWAGIML